MSIRDELAKVIAVALAETNPSGLGAFDELSPNRQKQLLSRGGHAADTILARYAVVELPEPDGDGTWLRGSVYAIDGEVEHFIRGMASVVRSPKAARAVAAAFLAAANRAEAQS
ncbi:hypothetical protein SAMN04490240_4113 [Rhodococcus pyridinivorans]|uniref:hypothetical protein n=1 Tax=Rhodococcus pyridinivorans TaxID=103816 RepID=UPI0007CD5E17|nr:hypothetical protein [Rhodococcus pyridinivorans]SED52839.1 hypothetical protein SAMN04490240_4113 [Rhodococcus pyridinivorans]